MGKWLISPRTLSGRLALTSTVVAAIATALVLVAISFLQDDVVTPTLRLLLREQLAVIIQQNEAYLGSGDWFTVGRNLEAFNKREGGGTRFQIVTRREEAIPAKEVPVSYESLARCLKNGACHGGFPPPEAIDLKLQGAPIVLIQYLNQAGMSPENPPIVVGLVKQQDLSRRLYSMLAVVGSLFAAAAVVAVLLAHVFARRAIIRPVALLAAQARSAWHSPEILAKPLVENEVEEVREMRESLHDSLRAIEAKTEENRRLMEQKAAVEREAAVGRITQNLAHDLRNPLGFMELALRTESWASFLAVRPALQSAYTRILALIDSIRHGEVDLVVRPSAAPLVLGPLVQELSPVAEAYGATVWHEQVRSLGLVTADHPKVERAVMNLLRNGLESGAKNVWLREREEDGDLVLEVLDDGPGVPSEVLGRLFERGNTFGKEGGTGLGLSFAKSVATGHGGSLSYERTLEGRTLFLLCIPGAQLREERREPRTVEVETRDMEPSSGPLVVLSLADQNLRTALEGALAEAEGLAVSVDERDLGFASLLCTDSPLDLEKALSAGVSTLLVAPSDSAEKVTRKVLARVGGATRKSFKEDV